MNSSPAIARTRLMSRSSVIPAARGSPSAKKVHSSRFVPMSSGTRWPEPLRTTSAGSSLSSPPSITGRNGSGSPLLSRFELPGRRHEVLGCHMLEHAAVELFFPPIRTCARLLTRASTPGSIRAFCAMPAIHSSAGRSGSPRGWNKPVAASAESSAEMLMAPADPPNTVTFLRIAAEIGDVLLHPRQCSQLIEQAPIAESTEVIRERRMSEEAESAQAVVHRHDDDVTFSRQPISPVKKARSTTRSETSAVYPDHHGTPCVVDVGRPDVEARDSPRRIRSGPPGMLMPGTGGG